MRAVVISLGDSRSYYLSTAANFLGVVLARSSAGSSSSSLFRMTHRFQHGANIMGGDEMSTNTDDREAKGGTD